MQRRPSKVCKWLGFRWCTKLKHFTNHSPIFTGVKKCEIWTPFSTQVAFEPLWFRNGATYQKSKTRYGSLDDCSKYWLGNLANPSPNFYSGCKMQNLAFEAPWFRNEATYRLSFSSFRVFMVVLWRLQIWYRSVHPNQILLKFGGLVHYWCPKASQ